MQSLYTCSLLLAFLWQPNCPITTVSSFLLAPQMKHHRRRRRRRHEMMHNVAAEEVILQQLSFLQNGRNMERAYEECFTFAARVESGGWQAFAEELQTNNNNKSFGPLMKHEQATVVMVTQSPNDPFGCQCLVRLILPDNHNQSDEDNDDTDDDDDDCLYSNALKIPLYYWFAMKLEESIETDRGILVRTTPGVKAVWKVEAIQPDFESLDWDVADIPTNKMFDLVDEDDFTETGEEFTIIDDDGNSWDMQDMLDIVFNDDDDDDDESFMIPLQRLGRRGQMDDGDNDRFRAGSLDTDENGNYIVSLDEDDEEDLDDENDSEDYENK